MSSATIMTEKSHNKRGPTSMYIDRMLWAKVRKAAVDLNITATEFVEAALREELKRIKGE
jgi:hypothetical protein